MKAYVSDVKKKEVEFLGKLMGKYKVVGIIDLTGMPSFQLQKMRKNLKDALIRVSKKRLIKIALKELKGKGGIEGLENEISKKVMPCLILTNENSFKLAKVLRKAKTNVFAKPGQIAPKDIIVKAGPTSFAPGPIIGEFAMLGIKAVVEGGKIVIKEDKVVIKEGDEINAKVADMLVKLGIKPMQIGLNLIATCDNGVIFKKDVLDVDDQWYIDSIKLITADCFKLAIQIGYVCKESIGFLIKKVEMEARALEFSKKEISLDKMGEKELEAGKEARDEKKMGEIKKEIFEGEDETEKERKVEVKEEQKEDKLEVLKKVSFKKPSAQELVDEAEREVKREEEKNRVPSAAELAERQKEKRKKEPEKIPTAAELAERKKIIFKED